MSLAVDGTLTDNLWTLAPETAGQTNLYVQLVNASTGTAYVSAATVDANGNFSISNVPVGTYAVYTSTSSSGPFALSSLQTYAVVVDNNNVLAPTGKLLPPVLGGGAGSTAHYSGSGVPSNALGANGDVYFRNDGGAGTTIYQKRAGSWVATGA